MSQFCLFVVDSDSSLFYILKKYKILFYIFNLIVYIFKKSQFWQPDKIMSQKEMINHVG